MWQIIIRHHCFTMIQEFKLIKKDLMVYNQLKLILKSGINNTSNITHSLSLDYNWKGVAICRNFSWSFTKPVQLFLLIDIKLKIHFVFVHLIHHKLIHIFIILSFNIFFKNVYISKTSLHEVVTFNSELISKE